MMQENINDREKLVLEAIIKNFILTTTPVASSYIAQNSQFSFSPATIRSVMGKLEEDGYIYQPHPSAGRVPTTAGYRIYVNQMMKRSRLPRRQKEKIQEVIKENPGDLESLLRESTRILAQFSHQLSILISPHLDEGVFHRLDITRLSSERLLLVISIKSGMVKTIMLEINSNLTNDQLSSVRQILNERLNGLKLKQIRTKFKEIVKDIQNEETGLIHIFLKSANRIFNFNDDSEVFLTGTPNMLRQPEFSDYRKISQVVELLEDKKVIVHILNENTLESELNIKIGEEIGEQKMENCSIIAARYRIDQVSGTLGIIGPMRMDYSQLVPLVEFTAQILSDSLTAN